MVRPPPHRYINFKFTEAEAKKQENQLSSGRKLVFLHILTKFSFFLQLYLLGEGTKTLSRKILSLDSTKFLQRFKESKLLILI